MKKWVFWILTATLVSLTFPGPVKAHPGRTNSSGCHTCRTNCPNWGLSYGEYHCHGGYTAPVAPVSTSIPEPTSITTPTHKPTATPTSTPEVKSETTEATGNLEVSPTPIVLGESSDSGESGLTGLLGLSTLGALGGGYWLIKRFKKYKK